ncbi:unnamed protein product [Candidula unifasciata]|uniref:EF-hand domain-containing protein n=1 Tax=Candidula unifasciata TaxID=100452 RepID=A0A8S3YM88_9EUPU|nr:unnamed protein product [Candidula unifasciata]
MADMTRLNEEVKAKARTNRVNAKDALELVQAQFLARGASGIKGKLSFDEFSKGIREVGVVLQKEQEQELFKLFDRNGEGTVDFDEFIRAVQVCDGAVTVEDLTKTYNVKKHPKYISGDWSEAKVYQEFLKTFEVDGHTDGIVTLDEFMAYYAAISCSIDSDAYFDLMMRNSWGADLAA